MMHARLIMRACALLMIFAMGSMGAAGGLPGAAGCGYSCEEMDGWDCFEWPDEPTCWTELEATCEQYVDQYFGPDCLRACQVADPICDEESEQCSSPEIYWECKFEIRDDPN